MGYDWWIDGNGQLLDERINDFFSNRFSSQNGYVKSENGRRFSIRMEDGSYKRLKGVSFWSDVHNIARIVLNRDVQIGKDYAITEIIHCKTRTENGVNRKCYEQCLTKWFNQILDVAKNVRSIVVVGKNPRDYVGRFLQIENPQCYKWYECMTLFGRNYKLLFVDHHAARKPGRNERIVNCVKES
jgi:hypothetical protein